MTMTPEQQRDIISRESAWVDDSFGQLDLSQFPALQPPPPETSRDDGRFAKDWRDTALSASAAALRKFVEDPDTAALEQVGSDLGHEGFRDEVRDRRGEAIAQEFKRACPRYIPTQANYEAIVGTLSFNALSAAQQEGTIEEQVDALLDMGFWTVGNLTATYAALDREGLLEVPAGEARNLSDSERLHVMRLAQGGYVEKAIDQYIQYALDDDSPSIDVLNDPDYRGALDTAVMFVFETATLDYSPSEERRAFLLRYAAGRPLTFNLLTQAWQTLRQREASYERQETLDRFQRPEAQPPSERELNDLSDEEVSRLYRSSLREYVRSIKAPGVLA